MQGFEALIAEILEAEGYWVRRGHKVGLTKEDKQEIGRPSSPRWEIDVLGYRAPENLVLAVECKSYLDSPGVNLAGYIRENWAQKEGKEVKGIILTPSYDEQLRLAAKEAGIKVLRIRIY